MTLGQRRQDPSSGGSLPTEVLWLSGLDVESYLLSLAFGVTNGIQRFCSVLIPAVCFRHLDSV